MSDWLSLSLNFRVNINLSSVKNSNVNLVHKPVQAVCRISTFRILSSPEMISFFNRHSTQETNSQPTSISWILTKLTWFDQLMVEVDCPLYLGSGVTKLGRATPPISVTSEQKYYGRSTLLMK